MATHHSNKGGASALPTALIAQAVPMLTRHELASLTERLIDALDALEPDTDLELNGDELDGSSAEDDYGHTCNTGECSMPGCPVGDADTAIDDGPCDEFNQDLEPVDYADRFADPEALEGHRRRFQRTRCFPRRRSYRDFRSGAVVTETYAHELFYEPTVPTKRQLFRRKRGVPRRPRG